MSSSTQALAEALPSAPPERLPEVSCRASSHFELGRQVGEAMASVIAVAFAEDTGLQKMYTHFSEVPAGLKLLEEFGNVNRAKYPQILEEVAGIAAGSGQPLKLVMLANMAQELSTFVPQAKPVVGCTDAHVLTAVGSAWGHTEDVTGQGRGYIVHSTLLQGQDVAASYSAFAYPGCVAGWAWGFNQHGVVFSINALTPAALNVGLCASFVSRDVLDATSLDDAVARATVSSQGGGQRFNLGSTRDPGRRLLIECSPRGCETRELAVGEHTAVCNVYLGDPTLEGRSGPYAESSHRRRARATKLGGAAGADALSWIYLVLGDAADAEFPIWRNAAPPDYATTDHCVVFDLRAGRAEVHRTLWRPSEPRKPPLHVFTIRKH